MATITNSYGDMLKALWEIEASNNVKHLLGVYGRSVLMWGNVSRFLQRQQWDDRFRTDQQTVKRVLQKLAAHYSAHEAHEAHEARLRIAAAMAAQLNRSISLPRPVRKRYPSGYRKRRGRKPVPGFIKSSLESIVEEEEEEDDSRDGFERSQPSQTTRGTARLPAMAPRTPGVQSASRRNADFR